MRDRSRFSRRPKLRRGRAFTSMELTRTFHGRAWRWFQEHARSRYALAWLALVSFADAIFFPVAPEVFVVALMLAQPKRWKLYLPIALISSIAGAAVGYLIAHLLFHEFGEPLLRLYGAARTFRDVQHVMRGHVFFTMLFGNFSPIPDKVLIYAGGFLNVHFLPFILGYAVGRGTRMSIAAYLAGRFGTQSLAIFKEYFTYMGIGAVALGIIYAMVHWHLLGF
jgi:membrane protein YqaA with SNARE-associated domain